MLPICLIKSCLILFKVDIEGIKECEELFQPTHIEFSVNSNVNPSKTKIPEQVRCHKVKIEPLIFLIKI